MQIVASESFGVEALDYLGVDTKVYQYFDAGFEVNPNVDTANDNLGFQFELEADEEVFKMGSIVYQWMTYVKSDDYQSKPVSIGCVTKVGDPYVSEVQTFNGTSSMSVSSSKVAGRTYDQQNTEEKAKKKESFGTVQDLSWYDAYYVDETTMVQPCVAVIENDGKFDESSDVFGQYNVTMGARIYANASDTAPKALPDQEFQIEFSMYETDLSNIYEEKDVPEEKAAEVVYLDDKFRFKIADVWDTFSGDEKMFWVRVVGGYKLYGASGAEDRWFFTLALERPTSLFTDGEIIYFWLKYNDEDFTDENTGVVGCKIVTGDTSKTEVNQWIGNINMASDSSDVVGKKWYKQNKEGKMNKPDYYARFYNDELFSVQASPRASGDYSIQRCEVEIKLPEGASPDTLTYEMQTGIRFYADQDATEFTTTPEPEFDWYRNEMEFSDELKEEPVYEEPQTEKQAEEKFDIAVEDVFADFMDAYNQYLAD